VEAGGLITEPRESASLPSDDRALAG
jgi:hypothetical protein